MALIKYNGSQFLFDNPNYKKECVIDYDFKKDCDIINSIAKKYGIFIYTTSSFRPSTDNIKGAVVIPAKKSNHMIGHAFDMNLFFNKVIYNNAKIENERLNNPNGTIMKFLKECDADKEIRWGGNFNDRDDIHFDDGLNLTNPKLWEEKYKLYHS